MIAFAILAFLVGAVLGTRWHVFMILATCAIFAAITFGLDLVLWRAGLLTTSLDVMLILVAHQSGYFFGAVISNYLAFGERQREALVKARV